MRHRRQLQRGAADLVSVAIGLTLLAITAIGTSMALVYGREALVQQEHFKVAAFQLRGELEKEVARIQLDIAGYRSTFQFVSSFSPVVMTLDDARDRNGHVEQTVGVITRDQVTPVWAATNLTIKPDYYLVTMRADWNEPHVAGFQAGELRDLIGPTHEIVLSAPAIVRD